MVDLRLARAELPGDGGVCEAPKARRVTAERSGPGSTEQRGGDSRSRGTSAAPLIYAIYSLTRRGSEQRTAWTTRTLCSVKKTRASMHSLPLPPSMRGTRACALSSGIGTRATAVSYTHLRAHETVL